MFANINKAAARIVLNRLNLVSARSNSTNSLTPNLHKVEVVEGVPRVPKSATPEEIIDISRDHGAAKVLKPESTAIFAGLGKLIKENGTIPFWGLLGLALISKEIIIWNPVILLAANNGAILFAVYIFGSEAIGKYINEQKVKFIQENNLIYDTKAKLARATADVFRCKVAVPEVVTNTYNAFIEANAELAKARDIAARQAHVEETLAALRGVVAREAEARRKRMQAAKDNTTQLIWDKINNDPVLRQAILKEALQYVGNDTGKSFVAIDKLIADAIKSSRK